MMDMIKHAASVFIGFASGLVLAGAVYAFITVVGVVPRLAQKTRTQQHIKTYESALLIGGLLGVVAVLFEPTVHLGGVVLVVIGLSAGVFIGCLAMGLAEVLNVIPILSRRIRLQRGLFYIVLGIAIGKFAGALLYFLVPGFFDPGNS